MAGGSLLDTYFKFSLFLNSDVGLVFVILHMNSEQREQYFKTKDVLHRLLGGKQDSGAGN